MKILFIMLIVSFLNVLGQTNIDSGLVAHYPFNGNANDESGNDNHCIVSHISYTSDRFGNPNRACYFDGDDSTYLSIPYETKLSVIVDSIISLVIWFQVDELNLNHYHSLISKGVGGNSWKILKYDYNDKYSVSLILQGPGWGSTPIDHLIQDYKQWHCLILRHTVYGEGEAYLDGITIDAWSVEYWTIPSNKNPLWIGNSQESLNVGWKGKIDDIRFYNRALTNSEIQELSYIPTQIDISIYNTISHFRLYENYPNPFNPSTTIEFDLPKTSQVTLKVYNILGEEVTTLVSDRLSAGNYSYNWDADNLASGVYLYRLEAGDFIATKKLILMK